MNPTNRGLLVAVTGAIALQLGLTDAMLHFLRPEMRPYLVAAGAVLLVLGLLVAVAASRSHSSGAAVNERPNDIGDHPSGHVHGSRVAWLLLVPVCIGVLAPSALDSYSAARATPFQQRRYPLANFDVARFLRSEAIAGGEPVLPISDYIGAARRSANTSYLATHDVRVVGFVTPPDDPRDHHRFFVTRFTIGCCAADAIPLQLDVLTTPAMRVPKQDRWVEVTLRLLKPQPKTALITLVRGSSLREVDKPSKPYDYF